MSSVVSQGLLLGVRRACRYRAVCPSKLALAVQAVGERGDGKKRTERGAPIIALSRKVSPLWDIRWIRALFDGKDGGGRARSASGRDGRAGVKRQESLVRRRGGNFNRHSKTKEGSVNEVGLRTLWPHS